jgi:hypothetical protein
MHAAFNSYASNFKAVGCFVMLSRVERKKQKELCRKKETERIK